MGAFISKDAFQPLPKKDTSQESSTVTEKSGPKAGPVNPPFHPPKKEIFEIYAITDLDSFLYVCHLDPVKSMEWVRRQAPESRDSAWTQFLECLAVNAPEQLGQVLSRLDTHEAGLKNLGKAFSAFAAAEPSSCANLMIAMLQKPESGWQSFLAKNPRALSEISSLCGPFLFTAACSSGEWPKEWPWKNITLSWFRSSDPEVSFADSSLLPEHLQPIAALKGMLQGGKPLDLKLLSEKVNLPGWGDEEAESPDPLHNSFVDFAAKNLSENELTKLKASISDPTFAAPLEHQLMQIRLRNGVSPIEVLKSIETDEFNQWGESRLRTAGNEFALAMNNPFASLQGNLQNLAQIPDSKLKSQILDSLLYRIARSDAIGLSIWASTEPPSPLRDAGILHLVRELGRDPEAQRQWLGQITDPAIHSQAASALKEN